ncbi:hypothetical protein KY290_025032 [Solanum tuberosum]|uniref:SWIM-type domain-containing protein n=1 Tax=Solanum tuberosum TaxID=4113 RepID=A0ABQ7UUD3_SOLTU|nr:hypothetical protein KY284_025625 [Solanum tuberosum]KAH0754762.1 hypothetical protein KY290_025032 [Solanum tuberosum]
MALRVLEKNIAKSMKCHIEFNGERNFEILGGSYVHSVDMRSRTCSCKSWMLKGIPCPHAIAAILYKNWEPIDYVDDCYSKETYLRTYYHYLQPVTNMKMWLDSTNPHVEPPVVKSMPGRPRKHLSWEKAQQNELSIKGSSRAIPKPRGRSKKTPTTTTEAPTATDGEPPRPKGRPRKTNVNPDALPRRRRRPRKTTNSKAPARGRGRTCEPITTSTIGRERDTTPDTTPARGRDIGIRRADTAPARGRGIGIGRADTAPARADTTPARGRGIGIEMVDTTPTRADTTPTRGRGIGIGRGRGRSNTTVQAPGRGRGFKIPLSGIGVPKRTSLHEWFENPTIPTKRSRTVGLGVFIAENGLTTYNPGLPSNRILHTSSGQPINSANVTRDLGFKPRTGVRWKGKKAMTSNQLEVMRNEMRVNKRQKKASSQSKEQWK